MAQGVEAVEQTDGQREQRQAELCDAERANKRRVDRLARCRRCLRDRRGRRRRIEQRKQLRAAVCGVPEADHHPLADDKGRNARRSDTGLARDLLQCLACLRVAVDGAVVNAQRGSLAGQPGKIGLGIRTVRAAIAHKNGQHRAVPVRLCCSKPGRPQSGDTKNQDPEQARQP